MRKQSSGGSKPQKNSAENSGSPKKFTLLELQDLQFISPVTGKLVNVEECSDAEFSAFISLYVKVTGDDLDTWSLEDRRDVLNFAFEQGVTPKFSAQPNFSPNFLEA